MRPERAAPSHPGTAWLGALLVAGCAAAPNGGQAPATSPPVVTPTTAATSSTPTPPSAAVTPTTAAPVGLARVDVVAIHDTIRALSEGIGPRETTTAAYREAAGLVERRLAELGYRMRRDPLRVPAGISWGVPVPAGRTYNVVAEPPGFDPPRPYLIVGAHLDTVPQAPGAEDNASGVAVVLELARLAVAKAPSVPVVFIAFAAEEPRGEGDDAHHYGSRHYVSGMTEATRRSLLGMISLDRVGVGARVPVCSGGRAATTVADELVRQAGRLDIPVRRCTNRSSDHWSFERAGLAGARVGSTPYPEYHSPGDRIGVVNQAQLGRVARLVSEALWRWPT